jgi:hypothetical protein
MKKLLFLNIFIILTAISIFPELRLIQPKARDILKLGDTYPIRWQAPNSQANQLVTILIETADGSQYWLVDNSRKKGDHFFQWTVGQIQDGSMLPAGDYRISLETVDDEINGDVFTIKFIPGKKEIDLESLKKKVLIIPLLPPPQHCPKCLQLDLRLIKLIFGRPDNLLEIALYKNGQLVASIGQIGQGRVLADFFIIKPSPSFPHLLDPKKDTKMELLLLNQKKEIIHTQQVQLKLSKTRPTEEKVSTKKKIIRK